MLHYIVLGQRVTTATSAAERLKVETTAATLAATPDLDRPQRRPGLLDRQLLDRRRLRRRAARSRGSRSRPGPAPVTTSGYDVVEKTIGQMRADMESGLTTSQAITRAYLDRIKVYDQGQFGFNAYEIVADDAMEQARKADEARAAGKRSPVLGIPIAVKNLFDTYDMATTNGSHDVRRLPAEEGRLPGREAARGGRGDHRQGRARGVRDERQLLQRPVGPGLERVPAVQVGARLLRRLGHRGGGEPRRGRARLADR